MRKLLGIYIVVVVVLLSSCGEGQEIAIGLHNGVDTVEINGLWADAGAYLDNGTERILVYSEDTVDTSILGESEITYEYTYEDIDYSITRFVMVADQTIPELNYLAGVDTVLLDEDWIDGGCEVIDNSLEVLTCATNSVVDTSMVGVYEVIYTAEDSSGNEGSVTRVVTVVE